MQKVIVAIEARNSGCKVMQHNIPSGLTSEQYDDLMVAVVNAGPPITDPAQLSL